MIPRNFTVIYANKSVGSLLVISLFVISLYVISLNVAEPINDAKWGLCTVKNWHHVKHIGSPLLFFFFFISYLLWDAFDFYFIFCPFYVFTPFLLIIFSIESVLSWTHKLVFISNIIWFLIYFQCLVDPSFTSFWFFWVSIHV